MKVRLGYPPPWGGGGVPEKSGKLVKTRKKSGKFEKVRYSFLKPGFLLTRLINASHCSITRDNILPRCRSRQKYPIRNWVNSFLSNHHVDLIFLTDTIMPGIVDLIRNRVNSFLTDTVVEKPD